MFSENQNGTTPEKKEALALKFIKNCACITVIVPTNFIILKNANILKKNTHNCLAIIICARKKFPLALGEDKIFVKLNISASIHEVNCDFFLTRLIFSALHFFQLDTTKHPSWTKDFILNKTMCHKLLKCNVYKRYC